jgi:hypothetical protein
MSPAILISPQKICLSNKIRLYYEWKVIIVKAMEAGEGFYF